MTIATVFLYGTNGYRLVTQFKYLLIILIGPQANGPLTNENVFDYFATSMFYDKQSNNQVLRMQTMHTGVPLINEAEELRFALHQVHLTISKLVYLKAVYRYRVRFGPFTTTFVICYPQTREILA